MSGPPFKAWLVYTKPSAEGQSAACEGQGEDTVWVKIPGSAENLGKQKEGAF